jgi:hypothetical protein
MAPIVLLTLLLLQPGPSAQAASFAATAEAHLKRASTSAGRPLDELERAHTSFDSAYLVDGAPMYLCRALAVTDLAFKTATFRDEQERLFWEETRRDDLERLQHDAETTGRPNCRFDPAGKPAPPRLAVAPGTDLPARPPVAPRTLAKMGATNPSPSGPTATDRHRARAHTVMGGVLTGTGLALVGVSVGIAELARQRNGEIRHLIYKADQEGRDFTTDETRRYHEMGADLVQRRNAAIGVAVTAVATLGTGIALLVTRKRTKARSYAIRPYGGLRGAGAVLHLRF